MSQQSYRNHLMRTFQQNGLLDQLKVQLRTSLLDKLKDRDKSKAINKDLNLLKKISASLIQQYLFFNNHHYTLSVFAPESGGNLYQRGQLASLLRISKQSQSSLLQSMLRSRIPGQQGCKIDAVIQTEGSNNFLLDQKLKQLDNQFFRKVNQQSYTSQQRMTKFQNQTRRRLRQEMDRQVDRIKTIQAAAIRAQQSQKARLRVQQLKQQLQQQYFDKLNLLKDRQKEAMELIRHKYNTLQQKNHSFRQQTQRQLQYLKTKEQQLKDREIRHQDWLAGQKLRVQRMQRTIKQKMKQMHQK